MANNVGVRQYLQGQGLASSDIDYDKGSGYVTVRGQNFIKPGANLAGTTYDSQANLDAAFGSYAKTRPVIQADGSVGQSSVQPSPTSVTVEDKPAGADQSKNTQYSNPYTQQIAELMKHLSDSNAALSQPVDVYSTPQYAAAKASQDRNAQQSIKSGQEVFGLDGMARSSDVARFAQNTQNSSNDYLTTQLVPQIIAQLQAEKQQAYQNEQNQFNNVLSLSDRADSQYNNDRTFNAGRQDAETAATGYFNPSGESAVQLQAKMDANSKAYVSATPEERIRLHNENLEYADLLGKKYNSQTGTYSEGQGFAGKRTIAGQQLDQQIDEVAYNHARDSLLDKRYQTEFDYNVKQGGLEFALKEAMQKHQISNDNAQIAISRQNATTSASNAKNSANSADQRHLMDIWEATHVAPEGITGVTAGTKYYEKPIAGDKPTVTEAKQNLQSEYVTGFDGLSPEQRKLAFKNEKAAIIDDLGIAGYNSLYNMYFDQYGDPLDEK